MAIQIGSNYKLNSRLFLDDRQSCESLEILQANIDNILYPEGFKVYCVLEKAYYINVANNGEEPIWEKDSLDISLEINDTEYSSSSVYSSLKIEQMKDNMNADITQTEDDIDDIDYRLTTVETEVLKINDIVGTTIKNLSYVNYCEEIN